MPSAPSFFIAMSVVTIAAFWDVRTAKIPNMLTYPAIGIGLGIGLWPGTEPALISSLIGLAVAFLPALLLFATGGIGGGDVKLLAALGALLGYPIILDVLFYSVVAGSGLGLGLVVWHGRGLQTLRELGWLALSVVYPGLKAEVPAGDLRLPFGVAILLGTLWVLYVSAFRISPKLAILVGGP
jgi:prepilin peptidase CpaA